MKMSQVNKIKTAEMESLLRFGYNCAASLKSCKDEEAANERRILISVINDIKFSRLARANEKLEQRRESFLDYAFNLIRDPRGTQS
jgi:hypothetical protein